MGIGGIESSVASNSTRSLNTKTAVPEVAAVQQVTATADNYAKVAKPAGKEGGSEKENKNPNSQGQMLEDGVPIQEVSKEKIESALRDINTKIRPTHTECQFSYHEETKRIAIKVLDQDTGEVIREIPPEKTLDMIAKSLELAGILVDEKR
ncbi:MAG: flagellar protein FlaG [Bacteroides sp.]|nr:flagellar protein FlaG [Bacteroides sp.]MCM1549043.1 flagellar protein FlaG [Clostridium sp.]